MQKCATKPPGIHSRNLGIFEPSCPLGFHPFQSHPLGSQEPSSQEPNLPLPGITPPKIPTFAATPVNTSEKHLELMGCGCLRTFTARTTRDSVRTHQLQVLFPVLSGTGIHNNKNGVT